MWRNLRVHFAQQYAKGLPAEEQADDLKRLMPHYDEGSIEITVLTVEGEPVLYISANLVAPQVDLVVLRCFGVQENFAYHNWRGDRVSNDDLSS